MPDKNIGKNPDKDKETRIAPPGGTHGEKIHKSLFCLVIMFTCLDINKHHTIIVCSDIEHIMGCMSSKM